MGASIAELQMLQDTLATNEASSAPLAPAEKQEGNAKVAKQNIGSFEPPINASAQAQTFEEGCTQKQTSNEVSNGESTDNQQLGEEPKSAQAELSDQVNNQILAEQSEAEIPVAEVITQDVFQVELLKYARYNQPSLSRRRTMNFTMGTPHLEHIRM